MPSKTLTLVHMSGLHMGNDLYPEAALRGFDAVLDPLGSASGDALLIAGDLFDSQRVPTETVEHVLPALGELEQPVVLLPGNHDTFLTAPSSVSPEQPENLALFRESEGEMIGVAGLDLSHWGSLVYDHRPEFRPLEGLPLRLSLGWYVVMGHGLVMDESADAGRSSPITTEELTRAKCDYIALRHVHRFHDISHGPTPAFYSGASSESFEPTVAVVTLDLV